MVAIRQLVEHNSKIENRGNKHEQHSFTTRLRNEFTRRYHRKATESGNENAFLGHFNEIANPTNSIDNNNEIGRQI